MESFTGDPEPPEERIRLGSVAVDGLIAGTLAALVVGLIFLILDTIQGAPLHTPSVLGTLLFRGAEAAREVQIDVPMAIAYNGVHFLAFFLGGVVCAYVAALVERAPQFWYLALVAVAFLLAAIFWADASLDFPGLGRFRLSGAALAGVLTMGAYLWWQHPAIGEHLGDVWQD